MVAPLALKQWAVRQRRERKYKGAACGEPPLVRTSTVQDQYGDEVIVTPQWGNSAPTLWQARANFEPHL